MDSVTLIPTRTLYALTTTISDPSSWAASWDRIYRQTFWLADGQRDTGRMGILLHKSEALIRQIVLELTVTGYFTLLHNQKTITMNVESLKQSFNLIAPLKEAFAYSFYQRLFADYPQTCQLFAHTDMKRQESSLMATLAVVISGVERGENLIPVLHQLGAKHQRYGAAPEHYPAVGAVLLETMYEYLGQAFTQEMQDSWNQAFELISTQMLIGTQQTALIEE